MRSRGRGTPDASASARPSERSIEQLLGLGGALWAGAGVLLLGVIFALVYAWDQGWLRPSPTARVIAAFSAGALLHLAGWWLRARRGFIPFAGVAHGLATAVIVLTSIAAYAAFRAGEAVLPVEGAIVGAWIGVVGGLMVTYAWGLTTPGVVAVIAAMLWPAMLGSDMGSAEARLVHVFIGALSAGAVSILRPRHALLLGLAMPGVWLWVAGLVGTREIEANGVLWIILGWAIIAAPAAWLDRMASRRADFIAARSAGVLGMMNGIFAWILSATLGNARGQMQTLTATVSGVLLVGHVGLAALTREIGTRIGHAMIAMAMLTVLPALLLDGFFISLAWLVMACLLAGGAWAFDSRPMRGWSAVLWVLVVLRLFMFDQRSAALNVPITRIDTLTITNWLLLAIGVGVIGIVFGTMWRVRRTDASMGDAVASERAGGVLEYSRALPALGPNVLGAPSVVMAVVGALVPVVAVAMQTGELALTAAFAVMGALLLVAGLTTGRMALVGSAGVFGGIAAMKWGVVDVVEPIVDTWREPLIDVMPVLNAKIATGAMVLALLIPAARWLGKRSGEAASVLVVIAVLVMVVGISSESLRAVDRLMPAGSGRDVAMTHHVVLSVLWGLLGFAAIVIGFVSKIAAVRYAGLGLLVITLMKVLFIDLAGVSAIWRILSFLTVGALLLGVSFIYHTQTRRTKTDPPAE